MVDSVEVKVEKAVDSVDLVGWKTKLGGVGVMLTGLGVMIAGVVSDPVSVEMILTGLGTLSAGMVAVGLGDKVAKVATVIAKIVAAVKK